MKVRKAILKDAPKLYTLINEYAKEGILLPRSLNSIYEDIRDFWVCEDEEEVIGCSALHIVWEDLAEIKSLAVRRDHRNNGVGSLLVEKCLEEAKQLGIKRVFVLTYATDFFSRFNFREVKKETLPHKVWGECINCVKFPQCDEIAMILEL
ncbi:N-acetyltransferase [Hydrogenobacter hydrogenophilus]|uniref:Amino-acid N-acetyltransferase n=1 Tax=Hydrogenobacter hydrogenophilus TaxID=35835 RepID=A0A285P886_9AQUI|nr:N-acetyltransferase [Hydrogenobacter hydrogenophilus]SNZ16091.1 amino-acid N-acetyltransferase [Hydrogenobacter hydrogenophilus]